MNILLCGKKSDLCLRLAELLNKEKHEVYLLTGNTNDDTAARFAFQEYQYAYTSRSINKIICGIHAEVMIILGADDTNYSWREEVDNAVSYASGLTSLLLAAENAGIHRVVYLSSTDIFETNMQSPLQPEMKPEADSIHMRALIRGEEICSDFREKIGEKKTMEITILRLPPCIGERNPNRREICQELTMEFLFDGEIYCTPKQQHRGIWYRDAAEAVMRVVFLPPEKLKSLYTISGFVFSEQEAVNALIATKWNKNVVQVKEKELVKAYPPLNLQGFDDDELSFHLMIPLEAAIKSLCRSCLVANEKVETNQQKITMNLLPCLEALIAVFLVFFLCNYMEETWVGESINLYVIYVALFSAVYGTSYSLLTAFLSALAICIHRLGNTQLLGILTDYSYYLEFLELVVVGVIAGYMKDKYARRNHNLQEDKQYLSTELEELTGIYRNNEYIKDVYEKRLLGYENSLARVYELSEELNFMIPQKIIFGAVRMLQELLKIHDICIYIATDDNPYLRLTAASSERAVSCGNSLHLDEKSFLYEAISHKHVYLNQIWDETKPGMAAAVYSDEKLLAIIMVWPSELSQINLYNSDMLAVASKLISTAMNRAIRFQEYLSSDTRLKDSRIMNKEPWISMLKIYEDGRKMGFFAYSILHVISSWEDPEPLITLVRQTDCPGIVDGELYILLNFTLEENAAPVIKRFEQSGISVKLEKYEALIHES